MTSLLLQWGPATVLTRATRFDRSVYLNIILSNIIEQNLKYQASSGREVVYSSIPNISRSDQTSYSNISLF